MVEKVQQPIKIDLNEFKLYIDIKNKIKLTLHFDSPSRRFYLSLIAFVVTQMKILGKVTSIPLQEHLEMIVLVNKTVGSSAGSSEKENLLPRIYRKWKDALPNLEEAPLFRVLGRKREYNEGIARTYQFTESEKDLWANLFEYKGSGENVRLRFSIDKLGVSLEDVAVLYEEYQNGEAWKRFLSSLKEKVESAPEAVILQSHLKVPEVPVSWPKEQWTVLRSRHQRIALIAMITVILGLTALAIWKLYLKPAPDKKASIEKMVFPLPDKPSIAVLPFVNMSDDPKQEYLADGLAEEIINALSKLSNVFVIARNSTFTYKGRHVKIQQVAEEMGIRYVLEGSVRKMGDKVRITAQLADALTGSHLMSEQYERDVKDVFAIQDDVTMRVLTSLRVNLTEGESARTFARSTKNLEAYLKILQAYEQRVIWNKESQTRARQLAEEAIALDPGCALAYSNLAVVLSNEAQLGVYDNPQKVLERAYRLAEKAVALDDSSAWSHLAMGLLSTTCKRDWDKATTQVQRAIALEPGSTYGYGYLV
jgi:TolB-like protein